MNCIIKSSHNYLVTAFEIVLVSNCYVSKARIASICSVSTSQVPTMVNVGAGCNGQIKTDEKGVFV